LAAAFLGLGFAASLGASRTSPSSFVSPLLSLPAAILEFEPSVAATIAIVFLEDAAAYEEAVSLGFIEAPVKAGGCPNPPFSLSFFSLSIISLIYLSLSSCYSCFNLSAASSLS
jgi:hypothetical protein